MKLKTYDQMIIELIQYSKYPAEIVALALDLTMHSNDEHMPAKFTNKMGKYLLDAEHTSPLEHAQYTFLIQGVSRSFLAQITRHRMGSFTSASQHYQDYEDYPCIVDTVGATYKIAFGNSYATYEFLKNDGVTREEARQVLPNAASVNLLWSVNARGLVTFLRQRLCHRNVKEMQIFAQRVLSLVTETFPELFKFVGPQCFMDKECKQGRLQCKEGKWKN